MESMADLSKNYFSSVIGKSEVSDFVQSLRKSLGKKLLVGGLAPIGSFRQLFILRAGHSNGQRNPCSIQRGIPSPSSTLPVKS